MLLMICFALALFSTPLRAQTPVLMQGFGWNSKSPDSDWYAHLKEQIPRMQELGITHLWLPPSSRSVAPQGYMPGDYYDLGSPQDPVFYGHIESLRSLIQALQEASIQAVADIVINHRTASHQSDDGQWNVFHHPSGKMHWEAWALAAGDYGGTGSADTGGDFEPAPDLDHTHHRVQADISEWLLWMRDYVGFSGFRFDYTKGYAPQSVAEYAQRSRAEFCVGEYWTAMEYDGSEMLPNQDAHRQEVVDWVDQAAGQCSSFDFTTKGLLQQAFSDGSFWRLRDSEGRPAGMLGWWPEKSVTFIDNHDTGSEQAHWPFPEHRILAGYAYILTHPGTPTLFYEHVMNPDWLPSLKKLMHIRRKYSLGEGSSVRIPIAQTNAYVAEIDGKIQVHLGHEKIQPPALAHLLFEVPGARIYRL